MPGSALRLSETSARRKQLEEERQARDRVQMLRQGDEEGYLKMLQSKKNARLESLLQQTADFMEKIASMVQLEKNRAFAEEARELARDRKTAEQEQKKEEELERVRQKEEEERLRKEEEAQDRHNNSTAFDRKENRQYDLEVYDDRSFYSMLLKVRHDILVLCVVTCVYMWM